MKNVLTGFFIILSTFIYAQEGYTYLTLDGGINIEGNPNINLGVQFSKPTFSAWEISIQYHRTPFSQIDSLALGTPTTLQAVLQERTEELYLAGVYYKPILVKKGNLTYNFRYGLLLGRTNNFVVAAGAGFEATYYFSNMFAIYLRQSNHYIINVDQRFRHSLNFGLKIPL